MRRNGVFRVRRQLLVVLICLLLCLVMGAAEGPGQEWIHHSGRPPHNEEEARAKAAALEVNRHMADVSLEMREQIDFLLTPALLMQEAVSDDVILTYPEE